MIPQSIIEHKRDGRELTPDELSGFLTGFEREEVPDYQMAAFLMAVVFRGLSARELDVLLSRMIASGTVLDLSDLSPFRVDKHSTGGVGDKASLVVAPLVASLGALVPMMSGRALGHTGGTLDKLESIPGFRTALPLDRFRAVLADVGCAMIGPTAEIAPLDKRLYALRDLTGTVPSEGLMTASILSKKLAEGINALVLDVKVGAGAFLPEMERARGLARLMVDVAGARGLNAVARLTAMDRPLGRAIGNGLEVREAIETLSGKGPPDLRALSIELGAEMLVASGRLVSIEEGRAGCRAALDDGRALQCFGALIAAQGGDARVAESPERLPLAPERRVLRAERSGTVRHLRPVPLGWGVVEMGGGRTRVEDTIDPRVGFLLHVAAGDVVEAGQPLGEVHAAGPDGAERGLRALRSALDIGDGAPSLLPLLGERIQARGE
ncbi:MAG: thymidine phosphorylase [Gemmatimonadota bacterium]